MVGLGYQWGKMGRKLRSVGVSLLQKSARESGEVDLVEIEILAIIIIMQVNGKRLFAHLIFTCSCTV